MVANLIVKVLPGVYVQMFVTSSLGQIATDVHMIESLAVHVEEISVPFHGVHVDCVFEVDEAGSILEDSHRLSLGILVEVASGYDVGVAVFLENLGNEVLQREISQSGFPYEEIMKPICYQLTAAAVFCAMRFSTPLLIGGRASPSRDDDPPLLPI